MNVLFGKSESTEKLEEKISSLSIQAELLRAAVDRGEQLLDEYNKPGIENFMCRWSEREQMRLARIGMTLGVHDTEARLKLQGQYNGAVALGTEAGGIQQTVDENRHLLFNAETALAEARTKLNKSKE
jgi:hypothetical protein